MNTSIKPHVLLPALCMGLAFLLHGALEVVGTPSGRGCVKTQTDATALSRGDSRPLLAESQRILRDATGLPCGVSRLLLLVHELAIAGAGSANLHGSRPWHLSAFSYSLGKEWTTASAQEKSEPQDSLAVSSEQRAQAKTTFKEQCSRCHGADGKGDTVLGDMLFPPDFTDAKWWKGRNNERLTQSITNGKKEMPAFGKKLTKTEILTLIAYVRCFNTSEASDKRKATCD